MQRNSIRVNGGVSLQGKVKIQGSKNAALPILAASLLTCGENIFYNCPKISDVFQMKQLLISLGCEIRERNDCICVVTDNAKNGRMPTEAVQGMRSSVCMLSVLLARSNEVTMEYPGGCVIGARPIDFHLQALEKMGAEFRIEKNMIHGIVKDGFHGADIVFPKTSVGATENVILAAVLAKGDTRIEGAAREPEVVELCQYLMKCGACIKGIGTSCLLIRGVERLQGCSVKIPADRIVAGTYVFAAVVAGGSVLLEEAPCEQMGAILSVAEQMGAICQAASDGLYIQAPQQVRTVPYIRTGVYPFFPTDLQSVVLVASLRSEGSTVIEETIFENRFHVVKPLQSMGASVWILDEKKVKVTGGKALHGKEVEARELRGGAAMVLAGLMAEGITVVNGCEYIMRGYENICKDLRELGARITSV